MEYLELRVNRLIRLSYGPFKLNDLGPSEIKEVPWTQIKQAFPGLSS
jgi:23S rRNA pseudouridine2605 synthase